MSTSGSASDVPLRWRLLDAAVWVFRALQLHRLGRIAGFLMLLPALLAVGTLAAAIVYLTWKAFHSFDAFLNIQGELSTENFEEALTSGFYRDVLVRTILASALVTAIAMAAALPLAYTMVRSRSRLLRTALLTVVFVPFLVGDVVRAYGWLVMIGGNGAVPWILDLLGLGGGTMLGTPTAVILGLLQLMLPLCALVLLPAIHSIDPELEHASTIMGARPRHRWRHVVLPLARPGLVGAAAVSFTLTMTALAIPSLLGNGQYDFTGNAIQTVYFNRGDIYLASAMGVLVLLITLVFVVLIFWVGGLGGPGRRGRRSRRRPAAAEAA
jgi:putative spermidine/putrescine transport system permease protein